MVSQCDHGLGEFDSTVNRVNCGNHLAEHVVELITVVILKCGDGAVHLRCEDAESHLKRSVHLRQVEQLVEEGPEFDIIGAS